MELSLVVDYVAGGCWLPCNNRSEIHHCRARIGNQIDVARGRVGLIEDVGKVCLKIEPGQWIPVNRLGDHMLFDFAGLAVRPTIRRLKSTSPLGRRSRHAEKSYRVTRASVPRQAGTFGRNVIRTLKSSVFQSWLINLGKEAVMIFSL